VLADERPPPPLWGVSWRFLSRFFGLLSFQAIPLSKNELGPLFFLFYFLRSIPPFFWPMEGEQTPLRFLPLIGGHFHFAPTFSFEGGRRSFAAGRFGKGLCRLLVHFSFSRTRPLGRVESLEPPLCARLLGQMAFVPCRGRICPLLLLVKDCFCSWDRVCVFFVFPPLLTALLPGGAFSLISPFCTENLASFDEFVGRRFFFLLSRIRVTPLS